MRFTIFGTPFTPPSERKQVDGKTSGLIDTKFHTFCQIAKVGVARGQFGPCVADTNDRATVEKVSRQALIFHP
jgi:hypothetical protein